MTRKDIIDTEVRTPAENARSFLATALRPGWVMISLWAAA